MKCKICMIHTAIRVQHVSTIKEFLERCLPEWYKFDVVECMLYLGMWLGPAAVRQQWAEPIHNWLTLA
eukprot:8649684-Karenia_brevis.AAC.1